jgi:hypothetical protein
MLSLKNIYKKPSNLFIQKILELTHNRNISLIDAVASVNKTAAKVLKAHFQ